MNLASTAVTQTDDRLNLSAHFDNLMGLWRDEVSNTFRHQCWEPINQAERRLELAMTTLAQVVEQARNQVP